MGFFDWFNKKEKKAFGTFQVINGQIISAPDNKEAYITNGYYNDLVYSVIKVIADKVRVPQWEQYKVKSQSSLKAYRALMSRKDLQAEDVKKAMELKYEALEKTDGDDKVAKLIEYPNQLETFSDFVGNGTVYKLITGDRIVWAETLAAGANQGKPQRLWNLPPQYISIKATTTFPSIPLEYMMNRFMGEQKGFPVEQILHDKYFNPEYSTNGSHLFGLSPLKAALKVYTRNNSAKTAQAAAFDNQGVKGVLYTDVDPSGITDSNIGVVEQTANKIKSILTGREYSGAENYNKFATAGYRMGWVNVGLSPVDLAILESEKMDLNRIAAIFQVPPQLVGNTEQSTYNNLREAEKAVTVRCAIPELNSFRECFNRKLKENWSYDKNLFVDYDQTCFTELDENMKDKVEWVNKIPGLSINRRLELLGLETIEGDYFDEPLVDPNLIPISEYDNSEVDEAINEEDETP